MITSRSVAAPLEVFLQMLLFRVPNTSGKSLLQRKLQVSNWGRVCLKDASGIVYLPPPTPWGFPSTSIRNAEVLFLTDDASPVMGPVICGMFLT